MRITSFIICLLLIFSCSNKIVQPSIASASAHTSGKVKNVILMIGDGMGLGQISGGMIYNDMTTQLERFPVIGLHKSYSADNLITDSAAGATAFSAGVKTYNGAVGVDLNKRPVKTILEEAEEKNLATGLVATSTIVHATPASFIAHNESRKNYEEIALDFLNTDIDIFIGGGKKYYDRRTDERNLCQELENKGYQVSDYFQEDLVDMKIVKNKIGYLTSDDSPLTFSQGRTYLSDASRLSIRFLDSISPDHGFFLMIEGSQIDWGGHANNADYIISEFKDFDQVIGEVLDWAEADGNTLVIVTADHETGGFAINNGSTRDSLVPAFTSDYHTATMIPVFAYGPGSSAFAGIYENTAIYHKMRQAYRWK